MKDKTTTTTISQFKKGFAKIIAYSKMKGINFAKSLWKTAKEELPKYLVKEGFKFLSEKVHDLPSQITQMINHI